MYNKNQNNPQSVIKSAKKFNSDLKDFTKNMDKFETGQVFEVSYHIDCVKNGIEKYEKKICQPKF